MSAQKIIEAAQKNDFNAFSEAFTEHFKSLSIEEANEFRAKLAEAEKEKYDEEDDEEDDDDEDDDDEDDEYLGEQSLPANLVKQYETRAANERKGGGSIDINTRLPSVAVITSAGEDYFFQEHEAQELLDQVPDNISAEDFILAQSQNW